MDNRILLVDENRGIHIPKEFIKMYPFEQLQQITAFDYDYLRTAVDDPDYNEVWQEVVDSVIVLIGGQQYTLEQDGDLWAVPINGLFDEQD